MATMPLRGEGSNGIGSHAATHPDAAVGRGRTRAPAPSPPRGEREEGGGETGAATRPNVVALPAVGAPQGEEEGGGRGYRRQLRRVRGGAGGRWRRARGRLRCTAERWEAARSLNK